MRAWPKSFARDERGTVAILFGLSVMLLMLCAGVVVDFARAHSSHEALQQDLDAALLFAATQKMQQGANFDVQAGAQTYLDGLRREKQTGAPVTVTVSQPTPTSMTATANSAVKAMVMGIFGFKQIDITASAEAALGQQPVEVALVLDNTYSMAGAKLAALQSATNTLLDAAYQAPNSDQYVKIGIVPFSQYVNVGLANRNQSWISVPPDATTTGPQVCNTVTPIISQTNCHDVTASGTNDGVPYTYTYQSCDYTYGPPVQQCYTPTKTTTWYGCVGSRTYPLDTLDEQYSTPEIGLPNIGCPSAIAPLTNDKASLQAQVNAMVAQGETYIPTGLMWGWRILSKDAPFDQATDYGQLVNGQPVKKILILMTDGQNTKSPTYPSHDGSDSARADKLTSEVCSNIKAKKIEVYAVAFTVNDPNAKSLLTACATSPSKFYDAADSTQLTQAFQDIAKDFSPLHLTR